MAVSGYGIAVLHSVVRSVYEYRIFPNMLTSLELKIDSKSTFKNSVSVYRYCVDDNSLIPKLMLSSRQNV